MFVCIWPKSTSFSNGDRVELVSCVVYHLSRRPWKVELLTGSMLAIVCAVGKEIDAFGNLDTEMTGWTHRCHFTCEKCTGVVRCRPIERKWQLLCMLATIGACSSSNAARRFWPVAGAFTHPEPRAIHLSIAPEMEHCFEADHQRCCTEKSIFKSMAKLLAMLPPIVAYDAAC